MSVPPASPGSFAERWTLIVREMCRPREGPSGGQNRARSVGARRPERWSAPRPIEEAPHQLIAAADVPKAGARAGDPGTVVVRGPRVMVDAVSASYQI
jgi:hypothetical protein